MAQQIDSATSVTLQETATLATVISVEAPPDTDSSKNGSPSSPAFANSGIGSVLAQETEDAGAVVTFEKTATIAAVNSFEAMIDNDSSPKGSARDGSANQDELSDIEPPPGLENIMIATNPPMLPFDVMATFHTAWNDSTVLAYGLDGSPKKAHAPMPIGGMSVAAEPFLVYGPHGSPKHRACSFEFADAPPRGRNAHGSPRRRAGKGSAESMTMEPAWVASTSSPPIDSVFSAAKRESIPLKVNIFSESLKARSHLSACAPEFVPGAPQQEFMFSPAAAEFVPFSFSEAWRIGMETNVSPLATDFAPSSLSAIHLTPGPASQPTEFAPSAADFVLNTLFAHAVAAQEAELAHSLASSSLSSACLLPADAIGWNWFDAYWSCASAW